MKTYSVSDVVLGILGGFFLGGGIVYFQDHRLYAALWNFILLLLTVRLGIARRKMSEPDPVDDRLCRRCKKIPYHGRRGGYVLFGTGMIKAGPYEYDSLSEAIQLCGQCQEANLKEVFDKLAAEQAAEDDLFPDEEAQHH